MNRSVDFQRRRFLQLLVAGAAGAAGCQRKPIDATVPAAPTPDLKLAVIDDPELARAIEQQWSTRGEGELKVQQLATASLLAEQRCPDVDAIVYPNALIGEMVERDWVVPFPERALQDPNLEWRDVYDLVRLRDVMWDRKPHAVPMGSPTLVLLYRGDVWKQRGLSAPITWTDYHDQLQQIAATESAKDKRVAAEPLGPLWRSQMLLVRAAAYAQHRSYFAIWFDMQTMKPLIDGPPFVRALSELVAANSGLDALEWTPMDTLKLFLEGNSLAAITWPTRAIDVETELTTKDPLVHQAPGEIRIAPLPGAREAYERNRQTWSQRDPSEDGLHVSLLSTSGRLASVTKRSAYQLAAGNLLVWISGKEWSHQISPSSKYTTLFRRGHEKAAGKWLPEMFTPTASTEYVEVLSHTLTQGAAIESVRLPGVLEYLAALDDAVAATIKGESTPEQSLKDASAKWDSITDQRGREKQTAAYRRSLNL